MRKLPLFALGILLAATLSACGETPGLRQARVAFNDAASADNAARFAAYMAPGSKGAATVTVSAGYAETIDLIKKLDQKKLQDDKLLGVALTMKAMAQWKLKSWDDAMASAQTLNGMDDSQVFPRDRAIAKAMPALIRIDQAHDAIFDPKARKLTPDSERVAYRDEQIRQLDDARMKLDDVLASTTQDDPVTLYLLASELAAFRNKQDAASLLHPDKGPRGGLSQPEILLVQCRGGQLVAGVKRDAGEPASKDVAQFWKQVLGPAPDIDKCGAS
jgi:hypothetical protein